MRTQSDTFAIGTSRHTASIHPHERNAMNQHKLILPPRLGLRMWWMSLGILMMGLSLSVLIRLELGTEPYSCFILGFSRQLHTSYGNAQLIAQVLLFLVVIFFGRNRIGIGTIANMVCIGYITDLGNLALDALVPGSTWLLPVVRFGALVPAMAVFVLGAALYMAVDLGVSPYDAVPFILSEKLKKVSFRPVRMIWDFTFMMLGFLLGGSMGLVTLLGMLFLGPVIAWLQKKMEPSLHKTP